MSYMGRLQPFQTYFYRFLGEKMKIYRNNEKYWRDNFHQWRVDGNLSIKLYWPKGLARSWRELLL